MSGAVETQETVGIVAVAALRSDLPCPDRCCHKLFNLFDYSNSWDFQIVLFGIQTYSKTEYIRYSNISQKLKQIGIWSVLTIRDNTVPDYSVGSSSCS